MEKRKFAVTVKFGHVGRNKYIIKTIPVEAENGKSAANTARWMGRVKHHLKDAIVNVSEINSEQFALMQKEMNNDLYFKCRNIQEQREMCLEVEEDARNMIDDYDDDDRKQARMERIHFLNKKNKQIERYSC